MPATPDAFGWCALDYNYLKHRRGYDMWITATQV